MFFADVYVVKAGDNLTKIAKSRGYRNPAPVIAFLPNRSRFSSPGSENSLRIGEKIYIPWHPLVLKKLIATSEYLATQVAEDAKRLIEEQDANKEDLDRFLKLVDAANFIANLSVEIGSLIAEAGHGAMSSDAVLEWLIDAKLSLVRSPPSWFPNPRPQRRTLSFIFATLLARGPPPFGRRSTQP